VWVWQQWERGREEEEEDPEDRFCDTLSFALGLRLIACSESVYFILMFKYLIVTVSG